MDQYPWLKTGKDLFHETLQNFLEKQKIDPLELQDPTDNDALDFSQIGKEELVKSWGQQKPPKMDSFFKFRRIHCQGSNESYAHTCNKIKSVIENPQLIEQNDLRSTDGLSFLQSHMFAEDQEDI